MALDKKDLIDFLNDKVQEYNALSFIEDDPVSFPHRFSSKNNIEIAGFFAATLAWGQRKSILKSLDSLIGITGGDIYDFTMSFASREEELIRSFYYRTFQGEDAVYFFKSLKNIYTRFESLEQVFKGDEMEDRLSYFRSVFFELSHQKRTEKHVANVAKGAACKRIMLFLRWMVRKDDKGVDFGLWNTIKPSELYLPLDVHTGNISRKLGLLSRTQNDWKAVNELTQVLRTFDEKDPVKYDYALFGLGVEGF